MSDLRLALSKPDAEGKRHLVLRGDGVKMLRVLPVIRKYVLPQGRTPVLRYRGTDTLVMFNQKYLDRLFMTFPDAELSDGLRRRLAKQYAERTKDMEIPDVQVPGFEGTLWDFQKVGVAEGVAALRDNGVHMLNDEMGLGKTIQALCMLLKLKKKRVLIVTTKSGCGSWAKIIKNLFPRMKYVVVDGTPAQRASLLRNNKVRITLVNFEALRVQPVDSEGKPWRKRKIVNGKNVGSQGKKAWRAVNPDVFNQRWDGLVVDEFHKCKNPEAQKTAGLLALPKCEHELMMSGTPFLNNPLEMWPTLHRLWPRKFPSFYSFENNLAIKDGEGVIGYNPDAMIELRDFLDQHSMRRRKDQVGVDMPEVIYTTRLVELTPEQRRLYNKIKQEFKLLLDSGEIKTIKGALPQITRLKQACFSPELYGGSKTSAKIEELRDIVQELVASGEKAIIFSQWEEACEIIRREFAEYNPAYVTGKVTGYCKVDGVRMTKRMREEDKFNMDDTCKLYIGTIDANQEAITLSAGTYVIFTDKAWTPLANEQAAARSAAGGLRGVGVTVPVNIIELFAEDSFEARIEEVLSYKKGLFDKIVERDGGTKDTRKKVAGVTVRTIRDMLVA
jgi:SNF2 family DNA or RNA helicase